MNDAIRTTATAHRGVRRVDYRVDFLLRNVATNRGNRQHAIQYASTDTGVRTGCDRGFVALRTFDTAS